MKRSRMLLFFGALAVAVAGYISWCSRPFYLQVKVPEIPRFPEEFRAAFMQEIEDSGLAKPEKFTFSRFWRLLGHPYDSAPQPIQLEQPSSTMVVVLREGMMDSTVTFMENEGRWMVFCRTGTRLYEPNGERAGN